jgi:hypothetical protein
MRLYDILDEKGRYCGFKATMEKPNGEVRASHTFSYAYQREQITLAQELHKPRNMIHYQLYVSTHRPTCMSYEEYVDIFTRRGFFE